ncbi:WD40/YVTN/BNR-like repeat-containing protein [Pseudomonas benzenivorans]|uniref:WD40/YVTN/BNR-like repeat-containing protein n=1 Tax=Pseudomonas benzenivorans TaxID=556533 RepID=UPI002102FD69|nr:sialidase family protein [Pseudomonas benzenivorans]
MADVLHVATRKGLLTFTRTAGAWALARSDFLGEPVSMVLADRRDGHLYAALHLGHFGPKLWRSADGGRHWVEIAAPAFAANADGQGPSVEMIWSLECGGVDQPQTLWAGTLPGALFRSDDRGESWELNDALWQRPERAQWFGGGYDQPGIHSICIDPRDSARLQVAVSCGGGWCSDDAGSSWVCRTQGMRAAYMPPELAHTPEIQDPHRMVACPAQPDTLWVQHHNGIFLSRDGGMHWREIEGVEPVSKSVCRRHILAKTRHFAASLFALQVSAGLLWSMFSTFFRHFIDPETRCRCLLGLFCSGHTMACGQHAIKKVLHVIRPRKSFKEEVCF